MQNFIPHDNNIHNDTQAFELINESFYPSITSQEFRQVMRVHSDVVNDQLEQALVTAMIHVNTELRVWRSAQTVSDITQVPSVQIGERTQVHQLYLNAVYNYAKALLTENYRDYDSTKSDHKKADEMESKIDVYRRLSIEAIRLLIGTSRTTVELI